MDRRMGKKMINVEDYDIVICVKGPTGRLFEKGQDTSKFVKDLHLFHGAGEYAELTVTRTIHPEQTNEDFRLGEDYYKPHDSHDLK